MGKSARTKDELKQLAVDAKARMTKGYWDKVKKSRDAAVDEAVRQGKDPQGVVRYFSERCTHEIAAMRNEIDRREEELYQKVKAVLDRGEEVANPTALLMDREYMNRLSDSERQRYLFSLMNKYGDLKRRYEHEKQLLDGIRIAE